MASDGKKVTLKSSDGEEFEVEEVVAVESQTIKHMIEDDCADNAIPLPNVNSRILAKVIEYCKKHVDSSSSSSKSDDRLPDDDLKSWDAEFVKVDQATLFDLILVMSDPQVAADGFTYEAEAIKGWLEVGHDTSPMTNMKLPTS